MKCVPCLMAAAAMLAITPLLFAQTLRAQNEQPTLPSDFLGPQLIVWSQQQEPQPVLQSTVDAPAHRQPEVRTFTGRIVKGRTGYFLQLSNGLVYQLVYQLENEPKWERYESKEVELTGTRDDRGSCIHVTGIHLHS
jgi:hypothetical protein